METMLRIVKPIQYIQVFFCRDSKIEGEGCGQPKGGEDTIVTGI